MRTKQKLAELAIVMSGEMISQGQPDFQTFLLLPK